MNVSVALLLLLACAAVLFSEPVEDQDENLVKRGKGYMSQSRPLRCLKEYQKCGPGLDEGYFHELDYGCCRDRKCWYNIINGRKKYKYCKFDYNSWIVGGWCQDTAGLECGPKRGPYNNVWCCEYTGMHPKLYCQYTVDECGVRHYTTCAPGKKTGKTRDPATGRKLESSNKKSYDNYVKYRRNRYTTERVGTKGTIKFRHHLMHFGYDTSFPCRPKGTYRIEYNTCHIPCCRGSRSHCEYTVNRCHERIMTCP